MPNNKLNTTGVVAEMLHDFNPNLNVMPKPTGEVVATIHKLDLNGDELRALADITGKGKLTLDRTGGKLRMTLQQK